MENSERPMENSENRSEHSNLPDKVAVQVANALREYHRSFWQRALPLVALAEYIQRTSMLHGDEPEQTSAVVTDFIRTLTPEMQVILQLYMETSRDAPEVMHRIAEGVEADSAVENLLENIDGVEPSQDTPGESSIDTGDEGVPFVVALSHAQLPGLLENLSSSTQNSSEDHKPDAGNPDGALSELPAEMRQTIRQLQNPLISNVLSTIASSENLRARMLRQGKSVDQVQVAVFKMLGSLTPEVQAGLMYYIKMYQNYPSRIELLKLEAAVRGVSPGFDPGPLIHALDIKTYSVDDTAGSPPGQTT